MDLKKIKIYLTLFSVNFYISAFTFGGGYIVIAMMKKLFIDKRSMLDEEELLDMTAIAQSTPGSIAINLAVLVGNRISGMMGSIVSLIGSVLPPLIILIIISAFYNEFRENVVISLMLKGMGAGVAATILDLVVNMIRDIFKQDNILLKLIVPFAFVSSYFFGVNVALIIIICSVACFLQAYIKNKEEVN